MTYCIASEALMYPFNSNPLGETVFKSFKRAYLNVFGDINMDGIENNLVEGEFRIHTMCDIGSLKLGSKMVSTYGK